MVSGTRTPQSSQRATVRTEVVTRDEAERRGATNLAQALTGESTLQVNPQAYGYLGAPSGVQIQGLDGDRVLILEDGEPVFGDVGGVVDLSQIALMDTERIEYVQGPTSSLYGTNAIGGVINVISGPPRAPGPSLRFREEARSRGELFAETTAAHRDGENWQAVDASFHGRQGVPFSDKPDLLVPYSRLYSVGVRSGLEPAPWIKLRVKTRWMHDETDGFSSRNLTTRYFRDTRDWVNRITTQVQSRLEVSKKASLELSLRKTWFATRGDDFYRDSPVGIVRRRRFEDQSIEGILTFADGPKRTWVFGTRHELQQFEQSTLETKATETSTIREYEQEVSPTMRYTGAFYAQLGWRLLEDWTFMPGVRAEVHDEYHDVIAPRLALAWQANEATILRAALGRGFRAPSARELGLVFDHSTYGYEVEGDSKLRPEQSWGVTFDATAKTKLLRVRVGGFANWISDLIDLENEQAKGADVGGNQAPRRTDSEILVYRYGNLRKARTAGADASVRLTVTEMFAATAGYSYLWTRDEDAEKSLPGRPAHTGTLTADVRLPFGLGASMQYKIVSDARGFDDDEGDGRAPGFSLLDARAALKLWPSLETYLGIQNVTDVHGHTVDPNDLRPALGRTIYFGFKGLVPGDV